MHLNISHTLRYCLAAPGRAVQHLLLSALATPQQKVESWSIDGSGVGSSTVLRDGFGNRALLITLLKPEPELELVVTGRVEMVDRAGVLGRLDYDPAPAIFRRTTALTGPDPRLIADLPAQSGRVAALHALMDRVHRSQGSSTQTQAQEPMTQTQGGKAGATELAHAFIGAARALDIPARYVTGYLFEDGVAQFHAWAEAWDEGLGWIGFDPALNFCPTTGHVRIASALDAASAAPIRSVPALTEPPAETLTIAADQGPST